jgi:hypothetical protein
MPPATVERPPTTYTRSSPPRFAPSRRPACAPRSAGPTDAQVLAEIRRGSTQATAIAKALESSEATISRSLAKLADNGAVRREGEKARTRWLIVGQPGGMQTARGSGAQGAQAAAA